MVCFKVWPCAVLTSITLTAPGCASDAMYRVSLRGNRHIHFSSFSRWVHASKTFSRGATNMRRISTLVSGAGSGLAIGGLLLIGRYEALNRQHGRRRNLGRDDSLQVVQGQARDRAELCGAHRAAIRRHLRNAAG